MRDYGANERGMGSEKGQPNVRRCHERSCEDGAMRADPQAVQEQPRAFLEEKAKEPDKAGCWARKREGRQRGTGGRENTSLMKEGVQGLWQLQ